METSNIIPFINTLLPYIPEDWLRLTTHRLDIYNEEKAKVDFLTALESLFQTHKVSPETLANLPTAYDYIRLGHPLSSILEWALAKMHGIDASAVIGFSSLTMPMLAILRENALQKKQTTIYYTSALPSCFNQNVLQDVYGYSFEVKKINDPQAVPPTEGSSIVLTEVDSFTHQAHSSSIDFLVQTTADLGSMIMVFGDDNKAYIPAIQHVRRRETIALTPLQAKAALQRLVGGEGPVPASDVNTKNKVLSAIQQITQTDGKPLLASSGLSMQYAIMMGLTHYAQQTDKAIKWIVPPNCYGGTNDQARRLAASLDNVEILDLPVDKDHNMVDRLEEVLTEVAKVDAIPFIIAEIPTNPRVEVPDLEALKNVLGKTRYSLQGDEATAPVFVLDQTFCPNVHLLAEGHMLSAVQTIAYVSGSKFPSGGKCTAGYAVANKKAAHLLSWIEKHLTLCDNQATAHQVNTLAEQIPSMEERIEKAYKNTRDLVHFIREHLPQAGIHFVSDELAEQGFTPSVFSLDIPSSGKTSLEKQENKNQLNHRLIRMMIEEIPNDSKHCVSYGQLKGSYWTIPATSTQGTTKEGDKDYIVRASLSPQLDLDKHKATFLKFVASLNNKTVV